MSATRATLNARNPIMGLFWRAMAWFPVAFLVWVIAAPLLHFPIALVMQGLSWLGVPQWLHDVEQGARHFHFITSLRPPSGTEAFSDNARVTTDVNGLLYTFGLPLFAALTLASAQPQRARALWLGYLMLLPFQCAGIYATGLKQIAFDMGPIVAQQMEFGALARNVVAYVYQFSTLIMPPVTALLAWFLLHRKFVEGFVRGRPAKGAAKIPAAQNRG